MKFKYITIFIILLFNVVACTAKKEATPEDLDRFGAAVPVVIPTNEDLSYAESFVKVSSNYVILDNTINVTLKALDQDRTLIPEGGLTATFEALANGTSVGTFSAVTDNGDGTYSATYTGDTVGTPITIRGKLDGEMVLGTFPFIEVVGGGFRRPITVSSPTDQVEYQVKLELDITNFTYANADANGDDLRFYSSVGIEYPYFIEKWSVGGTSTVWVKILESGVSSFNMTYGNAALAAGTSKTDTFSYLAAKYIYQELNSNIGGSTMNIANYGAAQTVTVETSGGPVAQVIATDAVSSFANAVQGKILVNGPISGRTLEINSGTDTIIPLTYAGTKMGYTLSRGTDDWDFYNPMSTTANLTITSYDSGGNDVGDTTLSIAPGAFQRADFDVSQFGYVESDIPILGLYYVGNTSDSTPLIKGGLELLGARAKSARIGILENGTTGTAYAHDGSSVGFSGDKGNSITISLGTANNQTDSVGIRIVSDKQVVAQSQADSDGSDTAAFMPVEFLNSEYIIPTLAQYITIVCNEDSNITVFNPDTSIFGAGLCDATGATPGKISFGTDGGTTPLGVGTKVVGDANFYMYYEYDVEDETNITSWKDARSFMWPEPTTTVGIEQNLQ